MTPDHRALARHALGLPHAGMRSWRNHFVAGEGHADFDHWREMVGLGFASRHKGSAISGGDPIFTLTRAGADRALEPGESLSDRHFPFIGQD